MWLWHNEVTLKVMVVKSLLLMNFTPQAETTGSDSDSSVNIQALQMGGSEKFRAPTQHKKSKQSSELIQDNKEAVYMQKMFCKKIADLHYFIYVQRSQN
jgi:hypothetical protein